MARRWAERILDVARLTDSGRPQLQANEVEQQLLDGVDLEGWQQDQEPLKLGLVILTTLRVIWVDEQGKLSFSIPLAAVSKAMPPRKSLKNIFNTPRLKLQLWITANGKLCSRGQGNHEAFLSKLGDLLQSKPWEFTSHAASSSSSGEAAGPSTSAAASEQQLLNRWNPSRAGVSGILKKEQEQWEQADKDLQDAFQDLNALMRKAQEMVLLADKMRAKLLSAQTSADDGADKQEIQDWLLRVGITSPVTKETAGALYHQQLARQLADFVWRPLQQAGGMLAMVDVYCLFNRARGTELISPDDLLQACAVWERIDVPVKMRQFESGSLVVQTKSGSDEEVISRIMQLVEDPSGRGVDATMAARSLGVSPALAKEHMLAAENRGLLCRDDGSDGLRFFANFFKDIVC